MLVANSFDLWQKDAFFSAAEEVQQSADVMESSYRTWLRGRREGWAAEHLDELARELQMALGTAKWQLEEFEKAVRMSYRSHGDDITISRHSQFVSVLEDQISLVEAALKESFEVERKKEFSWVNLDEEESDDFALFLSGTSGTSQRITDQAGETCLVDKKNNSNKENNLSSEGSSKIQIPNRGMSLQVADTESEDAKCSIEQEETRSLETVDKVKIQSDRIASNRRNCSPSDRNTLEIVIDKNDAQKNALVEPTPREKGLKPFSLYSRGEDHPGAKGGVSSRTQLKLINWINQRLRGGNRSQRQLQMLLVFPVNSIRFVLAFMLTIFLVVPFLVYSN